MSDFQIVLTAEQVDHCPLFDKGHKMTLELPALALGRSDRCCVYALGSFLPFLVMLTRSEEPEQKLVGSVLNRLRCCKTNRFACCGENNYATFHVSVERKGQKIPTREHREGPPSLPRQQDIDRRKKLIQSLRRFPFFRVLTESDVEKLLSYFRIQRIARNIPIIHQGEPGRYFYILLKGNVQVIHDRDTLDQRTLAVLGRGECFGEMSLLSNSPCSATVVTRDEITVLSLSRQDFHRLLINHPSLNLFFAKLFANRMQKTQTMIEETGQEGLMGSLETFPISDLTQTIFMNGLTGKLSLITQNQNGELYFDKGQIINAKTGRLRGSAAFYRMLLWKKGRFRFSPLPEVKIRREINLSTMALVLEGMRLQDEKSSREE